MVNISARRSCLDLATHHQQIYVVLAQRVERDNGLRSRLHARAMNYALHTDTPLSIARPQTQKCVRKNHLDIRRVVGLFNNRHFWLCTHKHSHTHTDGVCIESNNALKMWIVGPNLYANRLCVVDFGRRISCVRRPIERLLHDRSQYASRRPCVTHTSLSPGQRKKKPTGKPGRAMLWIRKCVIHIYN